LQSGTCIPDAEGIVRVEALTLFKDPNRVRLIISKPAASSPYVFVGNGNWSNPDNWLNRTVPPAVLPSGNSIRIQPQSGGLCLLDIDQVIAPGASLSLDAGAQLLVPGSLSIR
jgi:hypothetical protein